MSKLRNPLVVAVIALTLGACKGDDPLGVNSGDPMTEEELQVVFNAVADAFQSIGATPAASGPARATVSVNETFTGNAPCELDGTIGANGSAAGTVDDETFEIDVRYQLRLTPNGCQVPMEAGSITLEAAPYIQLDMDFFLSETLLEISGTETGGISYTSTDGRSGSCLFDVSFDLSSNLDTQAATSSVSGTVCGVSASNLTIFEVESAS